jgi:hypothetical protein
MKTDITKMRILSELVSRSALSARLGVSFSGARDMYEVCGYKRELLFEDYWNHFERNGIGKRIITAPVTSSWYGEIGVWEGQKSAATSFEEVWKSLDDKLKITAKLVRLDILSGIGRYGVLLLGFNDNTDFSQPLAIGKTDLLYIQPYHEDSAKITEWETNINDPRYGMPKIYTINPRSVTEKEVTGLKSIRVHHSRILHVAENALENDVFGVPRLQSSYNRVEDLEKIVGGSAEMYWQGALGGKAFSTKEGATMDAADADLLEGEIDEYIHGLRRYIRLQNMDVKDLSPSVSAPDKHASVVLDLISGDTRIPKRILIGSERGELASSQDEGNWNGEVQQRREQHVEPFILRPFIDALINKGILPAPSNGYQIHWSDLSSTTGKERAEVSLIKTQALATYVNAPGAEMVIPEEFFLSDILDLDDEQVERIQEILSKMDLQEEPHTHDLEENLEEL